MSEHDAYLTLPELSAVPGLVHGFGTRALTMEGLSRDPGFGDFLPVVMRQVHSDIIRVLAAKPNTPLVGDALVTDRPGFLLCVKTADCLPLLVADRKSGVCAAVHCGWKGTSKGLAAKVIRVFKEEFRCAPASLLAAMGPAIGPDCYEVGEDVVEEFDGSQRGAPSCFLPLGSGKYLLNLRRANRIQLEGEGIPSEQIFSLDVCTHCHPQFYSYRRNRQECGRLINFIGRKDGLICG
jgi:YfiH family protein